MRLIRILLAVAVTCTAVSCDAPLFYDPYNVQGQTAHWQIVSVPHFTYHYLADPADEDWSRQIIRFDGSKYRCSPLDIEAAAGEYASHMERWYEQLRLLFGTDVARDTPIVVYNYPDIETQHELIGTWAAQSIEPCAPGVGFPIIHLGSEGSCGHELIHLFQTTLSNAPAMLSEGMAVALAGPSWQWADDSHDSISYSDLNTLPVGTSPARGAPRWQNKDLHRQAAKAIAVNDTGISIPVPPIDGLRPSDLLYWGSNLSRQWYLYCVGGSFVHFLIETYGWEPFLDMYRHVGSSTLVGSDFEAEFQRVYRKRVVQVEQDWIDMLEALQ